METLEATIGLIREEAIGEESLTSIINRVGVAPIFQKLYQGKENNRKKITLHIAGMSCEKCVQRIPEALKGLAGVINVQVNLRSGTATVTYDPTLASLPEMERVVGHAGYETVKAKRESPARKKTGDCC